MPRLGFGEGFKATTDLIDKMQERSMRRRQMDLLDAQIGNEKMTTEERKERFDFEKASGGLAVQPVRQKGETKKEYRKRIGIWRGQTGALAGNYAERARLGLKKQRLDNKGKKAANKQTLQLAQKTEIENKFTVRRHAATTDEDLRREVAQTLDAQLADIQQTIQDTNYRKKEVEDFKIAKTHSREIAASAATTAQTLAQVQVDKLKLELTKYDHEREDKAEKAAKILKTEESLKDFASKIAAMMSPGVKDPINRLREIDNLMAQWPDTSFSPLLQASSSTLRGNLGKQVEEYRKGLMATNAYKDGKMWGDRVATSEAAIINAGRGAWYSKLTPEQQAEARIPFWAIAELKSAGIPYSVLADDFFSRKILRKTQVDVPGEEWHKNPDGTYVLDGNGSLVPNLRYNPQFISDNIASFISQWKSDRAAGRAVAVDGMRPQMIPGTSGRMAGGVIQLGDAKSVPPTDPKVISTPHSQETVSGSIPLVAPGFDRDLERARMSEDAGMVDRFLKALSDPLDDAIQTSRGLGDSDRLELDFDAQVAAGLADPSMFPPPPSVPAPPPDPTALPSTPSSPAPDPASAIPGPTPITETPGGGEILETNLLGYEFGSWEDRVLRGEIKYRPAAEIRQSIKEQSEEEDRLAKRLENYGDDVRNGRRLEDIALEQKLSDGLKLSVDRGRALKGELSGQQQSAKLLDRAKSMEDDHYRESREKARFIADFRKSVEPFSKYVSSRDFKIVEGSVYFKESIPKPIKKVVGEMTDYRGGGHDYAKRHLGRKYFIYTGDKRHGWREEGHQLFSRNHELVVKGNLKRLKKDANIDISKAAHGEAGRKLKLKRDAARRTLKLYEDRAERIDDLIKAINSIKEMQDKRFSLEEARAMGWIK